VRYPRLTDIVEQPRNPEEVFNNLALRINSAAASCGVSGERNGTLQKTVAPERFNRGPGLGLAWIPA